MKNINAEKVFKLYKIFLTIITITSGVCLFMGIVGNRQTLIELPLLAAAIVVVVTYLKDLIVRECNKNS